MTDQELIKNILTVLYTKDGKTLSFEQACKDWTFETAAQVAFKLNDAGYTAESIANMKPHDRIESGWCIEDVQGHFHRKYPEMSDEAARYVLHTMDRNHDATIGINWDVIDATLWNILWPMRHAAGYVKVTDAEDEREEVLAMSEKQALAIFEDMVKDHGDVPKNVCTGELEKAGAEWREKFDEAGDA